MAMEGCCSNGCQLGRGIHRHVRRERLKNEAYRPCNYKSSPT